MEQKAALERYYRRRFSGGRSAFARGFDYVALRALITAAAYAFFRSRVIQGRVWPLTLLTLLAVMLTLGFLRELRYGRFVAAERKRLARSICMDRLLLTPYREAADMARPLFEEKQARNWRLIQRQAPLSTDDLASALRVCRGQPLWLCAWGGYREEARAFAARHPERVKLVEPEELFRLVEAGPLRPDDWELDQTILRLSQRRKPSLAGLGSRPFLPGGAKKYLIAALLMTAGSFFVSSPLYYRMMASACMVFSAVCFGLDRIRNHSSA